MEDDLIKLTTAARETGVPYRTLHHAASKLGTLKYKQIDGYFYTTVEWVNAWKANPEYHKTGYQQGTRAKRRKKGNL